MEAPNSKNRKDTTPNDYAIAAELNNRVSKLIFRLADDLRGDIADSFYFQSLDNMKALNRSYVLLVNEIEKIYAHNNSLAALNDEPSTSAIWKRFNTLINNETTINDYINEQKNDEGFAHTIAVDRLAIIEGEEVPNFTPEMKKIVDDADKIIEALQNYRNEITESRPVRYHGEWYIPKYELVYKDDGRIVINGVLELKKTQSGSAPRKLMEQAVQRPNELFKPALGQITRNLNSTLSDMGITGTLKELFFPIVGSDGVKFRPVVDSDTAFEERIDIKELERQLKKLGAKTKHILDPDISDEPLSEEMKAILAKHEETRIFLDEDDIERYKT